MPRLLCVVLALSLQAAASAQLPTPLQADGVVRLLTDLESALASGSMEGFRALAAANLPAADARVFARSLSAGKPESATLRERGRWPDVFGSRALVEVFVSRGRAGRLATWQITARPKDGAPNRYEIAGLTEVSAIGGLVKLALDTTRQLTVHNLVFHAPDLTLTMPAGAAFAADSDAGTTILVLHGSGDVHFAPPDSAEQGQLRIFAGKPDFAAKIDSAFIRLNPGELGSVINEGSLVPSQTVDRSEATRAQRIFDDLSPLSFNLDLADLSREHWSLEPPPETLAVELRTAKYGWLTYTRSPGDPEDITFFDRARNRHISIYASAGHTTSGGRFFSEDTDLPYDALGYDLDLSIDPVRAWIAGRGSVRLRVKQDFVNSLTFRLAKSLAVSSVSSPSLGRLLALRVVGQNTLVVSLPKPVNHGAELTIDIAYSGRLPPQSFDREALALDDQDLSQDEAPVTPEPRFLYSSRVFWYPRAQVTDYATGTMRLKVPSEFQVVATGALTGSSLKPVEDTPSSRSDGRSLRSVEFIVDRPVPYLACVISRFVPVGSLSVDVPALAPTAQLDGVRLVPAKGASVNLEVVATPRQSNRNRAAPARVADILRFYSTLVGEAPYPNFTLGAVDDNLPGGHSPAYFAIWQQPMASTPYVWQNDPVAFDSYPNFFLAHEIAHQWWGQAVGWKNYHEQWLSEGLAQYFAALYAGVEKGPDTTRALLAQMRQSAMAQSDRGPIFLGYRLGHIQGDSRVFRALVYNKSAVVLHMLRRLIGDDAFMAGLQQFYRAFRFRLAGTDDLRAAFEAQAKMPLARFFDRWIVGSSLPRLRMTSRLEPSGDAATIRIEQIGDVFDLPLTVLVEYVDGRSEEVTIPVTEAIVERQVRLRGAIRRIVLRDDLSLVTVV